MTNRTREYPMGPNSKELLGDIIIFGQQLVKLATYILS